jgi:shikimate dehydrogenase
VTAGITGATRVYLHLAHPSAHARTPQVMNAEFARRGVDVVAVSADVAPGDPLPVAVSRLAVGTLVCDIVTRPAQTRLLDEAAAWGCVPHPGLPMLASQVDLILDFLGLRGQASSMIANDI